MAMMVRPLAAALGAAALALLTAGEAAGDDTGQTYAEAQQALKDEGYDVI